LNESWDQIIQALNTIEMDKTEKSETKCETCGLKIHIEKLEVAFMVLVWGFFLHRLIAVSKQL